MESKGRFPEVQQGVVAVQIEIRILEHFVDNPDACEAVSGIAQLWLGGEDPIAVSSAMQNLTNCGLLHRFGEGDRAVYYCIDVALVRAVLQMLKEKQKASVAAEDQPALE